MKLAPYRPQIPLASEGKAFCKVVAPPTWASLAHRFCVRVAEYALVEPEQVTPDDLTEEDYARFHLVLFGSILDNPAILRLYVRHRCFTDADYPGRGGVEIRSVVNPLGTGKNILLIGGTDLSAVHEATIGFHRSFSQITFEKESGLWLHPLNFCVSSANILWSPSPKEVVDLSRRALQEAEEGLSQLADYGLFLYQTDNEAWAKVLEEVLPEMRRREEVSGVERWSLVWTLIYWHPAFSDAFRQETDAWLWEVGSRLAGEVGVSVADALAFRKATALHRIRAHFRSLHGVEPFEGIFSLPPSPDGFRAPDGFRDWYACDTWFSLVFESERYEPVESYPLERLVREAVATVDNRRVPVGKAENHRHAANVLAKIAAFENDGRYVWWQRWLTAEATPNPVEGWYTGRFASDLLPREPDLPATVELLDGEGIAFRRNLDCDSEYLFLSVDGAVCRFTWRGTAWLTGRAWTTNPPVHVRTGELPHFGYCLLDWGEEGRRGVLWRHGRFFLFLDGGGRNVDSKRLWSSDHAGERHETSWTLRNGLQTLKLVFLEGGGFVSWDRGVVFAFEPNALVCLLDDGRLQIGETRCFFGSFAREGVLVDGEAFLREEESVGFFGLRRLSLGWETFLESDVPVNLWLDLSSGRGRLDVVRETTLREGREKKVYPAGSYAVDYGVFPWGRLP